MNLNRDKLHDRCDETVLKLFRYLMSTSTDIGLSGNLYIYNSVLTCRQHIINSSASAPPNAAKITVKKGSDVVVCMFGPEL